MPIVIKGSKARIILFTNRKKKYLVIVDSVFNAEIDEALKYKEKGYVIEKEIFIDNVIPEDLKNKKLIIREDK